MGLTVAVRNNMLNTEFPNANYYVALFVGDPQASGVEVSGGSYARQAVTFGAPSNGSRSNTAKITFPQATANWGTVNYVAIYDAVTAGTLKGSQSITAQAVNTNGQPYFDIGQLTLSLT